MLLGIAVGVPWQTYAVAGLLLVGHLPLVIVHLSYVEVGGQGILVDHRVRSHDLPWSRVAEVRIDPSTTGPARPLEIELDDGTTVRSSALASLARPRRAAERAALLERLEREQERHAFSLR